MEWGDSDAKEIANGEKVQLRSFSTGSHKVDTLVSYRYVQCIQNFSMWNTKSRARNNPQLLQFQEPYEQRILIAKYFRRGLANLTT